jgi:hypothetical protein
MYLIRQPKRSCFNIMDTISTYALKLAMTDLAAEWRKRADEVEKKFGIEHTGVCVHAEILRGCAAEVEKLENS